MSPLSRCAAVVAVLSGLLLAPAASAGVPEPEGYRLEDYRAPVPSALAGATVLDTAGLLALLAEEPVVLLDVMPAPRRPPGRGRDRPWLAPPRRHLPGSVWLPNVGLGEPPPSTSAWFAKRLAELTGGAKDRAIVVYCERDCWMSWNAAKRAVVEFGYRRVYWYPDGVQGWEEAGLPLVAAVPEEEP
ncbi:MAG: PQQ-dependent catabolism-associated CXXCW motif protein [Geminicoccaceae bacterium]|nr:PQQ-dependent catabolism-associated CXXCW motif protein [Geminicoccaceae bacterium]MDW8125374.1 PQQ-dependent catabolism-associated CXXCW motif protein [Geminicoccaceae bacterium]